MLRLVLTLFILFYASLLDWRRREIDDRSWLTLVALGAVFFLYDFYRIGNVLLLKYFVLSLGVSMVLALVLYYTGLMGGGDGKMLMGIAAVYPFYPAQMLSVFPLPVLSVFTNAVLLAVVIPFLFFILNIRWLREVRSSRDLLVMFLGYRKKEKDISEFEAIIGGDGRYSFRIDSRKVELGKKGVSDKLVWVSPALPFVIFMTFGFILTYLGIDIFTQVALNLPWKG